MMANRFMPGRVSHEVWGPGFLHLLLTFALLAAMVALAVWLIVNARKPAGAAAAAAVTQAPDPVLHEVRMRYARGEMTREEFLQIAGDLGGAPPGTS